MTSLGYARYKKTSYCNRVINESDYKRLVTVQQRWLETQQHLPFDGLAFQDVSKPDHWWYKVKTGIHYFSRRELSKSI